ncbi:MAG: efflux RND transporter periplasmic adaptor subunit [Metallibacterium scheffleri]
MNRKIVVIVVAALAVAVAAGYLWGRRTSPAVPGQGTASVPRKILYWYDPMAPGQRFDHPGPSPTMPSMQLVPKYAGAAGGNEGGVRISPRIEQNLGMRAAVVRVGVLHRELRVPGVMAWDRRRSVVVSARADGVLSRLFVRAPFDRVQAGQPLAELLAPAWSSAVAEYRVLEQAHSADARGLRGAALQRLRVLGMSADEIRSADVGAGVVLRAPVTGVVSALEVRQGQQVSAGMTLLRIDDLTRLWLDAAIPQAEVAGIGAGTRVQVEVNAFPGRIFNGRVEALLPEVDARTRTETARIALDNPDGTLAPGMYATVKLAVAAGKPHPLVPDEALISTGVQNRVILDLGDGRMAPRAVRIGRSADGYTEVLAGLSGGERVVTSGQFLIDSEANLDGTLQRLTTPPASRPSAAPDVPAVPVVPASSAPTVPARPSVKPPAHDAMPGMAMPASTRRRTP